VKLLDKLAVHYEDSFVGTLAAARGNLYAFQYSKQWLAEGFSISPFSLPLSDTVYIPKIQNSAKFGGLFGVFADSLPDGWGQLLVDRFLETNGLSPDSVDQLNRLALTQGNRKGALSYHPLHYSDETVDVVTDFDSVYENIRNMLTVASFENFDDLYRLAGSSGGARPKVNVTLQDEEWIIKFPSRFDKNNHGVMEYDYSVCAKDCGIVMSGTKLFPSKLCQGFFGTKRFDRQNGKKIHTLTASALLETSHRETALDYKNLFAATAMLTKDFSQTLQLFRRLAFNVFAHNRDDHSNNFAYIFDDGTGSWQLSPAYDLTYSNSAFGQHATSVMGEGVNPTVSDLLKIAEYAGIKPSWAQECANDIQDRVQRKLAKYLK